MLRFERRRSGWGSENSKSRSDKKSRIRLAFLVSSLDLIGLPVFFSQLADFFTIFPHFLIFPFLEPRVVAPAGAYHGRPLPLHSESGAGGSARCRRSRPDRRRSGSRLLSEYRSPTSRSQVKSGSSFFAKYRSGLPPIRIPATIRISLPLFTLTGEKNRL